MVIKHIYIKDYKNLNINWDLSHSGNIVAILGKNASGKTNLLESIIGFSNVADNSKNIKTNFDGEMELNIDGKTIWINKNGVFQKTQVESVNRKSTKKPTEELDIPDFLRVSVNDDYAPRFFLAQRKYTKYDKTAIRFASFNEINYGDDFIPFLLYLFCFPKESFVRKILAEEFEIEGLSPIRFGTVLKDEEIIKLQEPTRYYFDVIKQYAQITTNTELSACSFNENDLMKLSEMFGYESDFFDAMHILLGNYYNHTSILFTYDVWFRKKNTTIRITDISDGEKQLIYILALMTYFSNKNTILLLDEPDTHIYPTLQMKLIDYMREINDQSQIIIATHSPYIVSSLKKEDVFYLDDGEILPVSNTKGKDINSIMTEIFNTPIRYPETNDAIVKIYNSLGKKQLNEEEKKEISMQINALAEDLGESDYDIITMRAILNSKS